MCAVLYLLLITEPVNDAGDTPLSLACANGHLDMIKYFAEDQYCNPRSKCEILICITQHVHACTNVGTVNKAGDTPLSLAYKGRHWEVVKYLAITHQCDTKGIVLMLVYVILMRDGCMCSPWARVVL